MCAAKLGEADVLIRGGINDVLITAEVVGRIKIERLMALLALTPDVKAVVDNEQNVIDLSTAALAVKGKPRKLKVAIDCNVGQNRTGLGTPAEVVALAQVIARQKGLELIGLQGYGGNNQHVKGFANRRAREVQSNERVVAARQALEEAGFAVQLVSVGGTGSYNIDADFPGVTEIQPGSYMFMDTNYNKIGGRDTPEFSEFGNSLSVLTTVISRATAGRAIVDAGGKALSTDEATPEPVDLTGATYGVAGDEYRGAPAAGSQPRAQGRRSGPDSARALRHDGQSPQRVLRGPQGHRRTRVADRGPRAHRLTPSELEQEIRRPGDFYFF